MARSAERPGATAPPAARRLAVLLALCSALVAAGCSGSSGRRSSALTVPPAPSSTAPSTTSSSDPATTAPAATAAPPVPSTNGDWPAFGRSPARTGVAPAGPRPQGIARRWQSPVLDGLVYAQPLVASDLVVAATEGDTVYALHAADGTIAWQRNLGQPVAGSQLPCGNIDPSGITGTPVVDPATRTVYVVAFVQPLRHDLVALDLLTGAPRWRRPVDPPGLSATVEQERSALTIADGRVYVAFGGLYGDCGPYKGAVVSSALDGSGGLATWTVRAAREGGVWAPAGPVVDGAGNLFVATGNTEPPDTFNDGNAVIRLTPGLQAADAFAPANFARLSTNDLDLGSESPALLDGGLAFVAGKDGQGYLLDAAHLGQVGGQVSTAPVCRSGAFGGTAWASPTLVVGCAEGPVGVLVQGRSFRPAWTGGGGEGGAPAVAAGTAWVAQRRGHLVGLAVATGAVQVDLDLGTPLTGFPSPSVTPTLVLVPGSNRVLAYGPPSGGDQAQL
jgi:outer membrane protein assembly factor BamB